MFCEGQLSSADDKQQAGTSIARLPPRQKNNIGRM
jgi:hypothetical protein